MGCWVFGAYGFEHIVELFETLCCCIVRELIKLVGAEGDEDVLNAFLGEFTHPTSHLLD